MDFFSLIVTLVVLAIVLGIAWWIVTRIPAFGGDKNWMVQVAFGLVCLLVVIALFAGKLPLIKIG